MEKQPGRIYDIAVIPGDGTGPEVIREGIKVLKVAARRNDFVLDFHEYDLGGERYLRTGEILPEKDFDAIRGPNHAIYLGAIGHPDVKPGVLERGILLRLRFELDQYINLRPCQLYPGVETPVKDKTPEDIDFVVIRENTGGLYTGKGAVLRKGTPQEKAIQIMEYDRAKVDRCLRFAFDYAMRRHTLASPWRGLTREEIGRGLTGKLHLVHKTNVLSFCGDLWERAFREMAPKYPNIKTDYAHVDATTMWMIKNPEWFDVLVTENMFGDIITDEAAIIQGGMGVAAGGNINPHGLSMFEPMGGSAPKYTGQNVINPLAAIEAGRMMLEHLGEMQAAEDIRRGVRYACKRMKSMAAGKMGMGTREVGDMVANAMFLNGE